MNKLKPLIASLIMLSSMASLAASNKAQPPNGFAFTAVGIGSNQYLGLYLSTPPGNPPKPMAAQEPPTPPAPVCNVNVQVLGMDGLPVGDPLEAQTISPGTTVFLKVGEASTDSVLEPQYFNVSIKTVAPIKTDTPPSLPPAKSKAIDGCAGLTGTLGVYDKATQDLQIVLPMLPAPANGAGK